MFRELAVLALGVAIGTTGGTYFRLVTADASEAQAVIQPAGDQTTAQTVPGPGTAPAPNSAPPADPAPQAGPPPTVPGPGPGPMPNLVLPFMPGPMNPGPPAYGAPGLPLPPGGAPGQPPLGAPGLPPGSMQPPLGAPGLPPGSMQPPLGGSPPALPPNSLGLPGNGGAFASAKPTQADVPYGTDPLQKLDLFKPSVTPATPAPIALFVHGGGWSTGDKADYGWVAEQLAQDGMLVAVVNYRLSPAVQHPAHVQDVAKALGWLTRNGAQYGGDPQRVYLIGHSAGAHLVSLAALDPVYLNAEGINASLIRGVIGIAGAAYDLDSYYASTPMASLLMPAFGNDTAKWAAAAPIRYVQPYAPPFFLAHGLNDTSAPPSSTQSLAAALTREGVPTHLELLPNADHFSVLTSVLPSVRSYLMKDGTPTPQPAGSAEQARRRSGN